MTTIYFLKQHLLPRLYEVKVTFAGKTKCFTDIRFCSMYTNLILKKHTPSPSVQPSAIILKYYSLFSWLRDLQFYNR